MFKFLTVILASTFLLQANIALAEEGQGAATQEAHQEMTEGKKDSSDFGHSRKEEAHERRDARKERRQERKEARKERREDRKEKRQERREARQEKRAEKKGN